MPLVFYGHPFSSYCQKALIALHERGLDYDFRLVTFGETADDREFYALSPVRKMPVLVDDGEAHFESSIIVEHVDRRDGRPSLISPNAADALATRQLDRVFDNYVMTPMTKIVVDHLRPADARDPHGVAEARRMLDTIYPWLDRRIGAGRYALGDAFTLADCAAAPSLFYADWVHEIPAALTNLRAYRSRLNARPSFARCIDAARPYRKYFPPGAPERD